MSCNDSQILLDKIQAMKGARREDDREAQILLDALQKMAFLYHAVNRLVIHIGAEGEVDSRHQTVLDVMESLYDIDGGTYLNKLEYRA